MQFFEKVRDRNGTLVDLVEIQASTIKTVEEDGYMVYQQWIDGKHVMTLNNNEVLVIK